MQEEKHKALVIDEYAGQLHLRTVDRPQPSKNQLLIRVHASTINPSDLIFLSGGYFKRPLPAACGIEGTGEVIGAGDESLNHWIGKRVSFVSGYGAWCEYTTCDVSSCFQISEEVDLQTAASGIVNPLTVIGFVEEFRRKGYKGGIIHTAGASNLGKMLNRLCQAEGIPLLAIVRKQAAADELIKEGVTDVVVTGEEGWETKLKTVVQEKKYDCLFDALGGGPTLDKILQNIIPTSGIYIYGILESKPLTVSDLTLFFQGMQINGFLIFPWLLSLDEASRQRVLDNHKKYLKTELSSKTGLTITLEEIERGLAFAKNNASEGKTLIKLGQ